MAIGMGTVLAGGALLGAIGGASKKQSSQGGFSGVSVGLPSELESRGRNISQDQINELEQLLQLGANRGDVVQGVEGQRNLASLFEAASESGGLPSQQQIDQSNTIAQQLFAPQRTALKQSQEAQLERASQLAAQLGRPINDPVIQSRLSREFMQGEERIAAQQGATAQNIALGLPGQQLNLASQAAQLRSGLASQAIQNRQTLFSLGNLVQQQGRQFRLGTAGRTFNQTTSSGGGIGGALTGALAGAGAGANIFSAFNSVNTGGVKTSGGTGGTPIFPKPSGSVGVVGNAPMASTF